MKKIILSIWLMIFASICLGHSVWAATHSVNLNIKVVDLVPPANVANFTAIAGTNKISLSWINPPDADLDGVRIQRQTSNYPVNPTDGTNVFTGSGTSYVNSGLTKGIRYYYTAFAYDLSGNYASGALASAIPQGSVAVPSPSNLSEAPIFAEGKPVPTKIAQEKIKISDFIFAVKNDGGWNEVAFLKDYCFFVGQEVQISIPAKIFPKMVRSIIITLDDSHYQLRLNQGYYEGIIKLPDKEGVSNLTATIIYTDGTKQVIKHDINIEAYGIVYRKPRGLKEKIFAQGSEMKEIRIMKAMVYLYSFNSQTNKWELWAGSKYKQKNPQETNDAGEYGYMTGAGKYYLEIKKIGFKIARSDEFEVTDQVINRKVEIVPEISKTILAMRVAILVVILIVSWSLYQRKKKKSRFSFSRRNNKAG